MAIDDSLDMLIEVFTADHERVAIKKISGDRRNLGIEPKGRDWDNFCIGATMMVIKGAAGNTSPHFKVR